MPHCGPLQLWPIYHYQNSADKLVLLPDGKLRHYIKDPENVDDTFHMKHLTDNDPDLVRPMFYDYQPGQYCMDKAINTRDKLEAQFARVCNPERTTHMWTTDLVLRKIVSPICHGISIFLLLTISVVYFVLPTLR